jgi:hypothetical protein
LLQPVEGSDILIEVISVVGEGNATLGKDALELYAAATGEPGRACEAGSV